MHKLPAIDWLRAGVLEARNRRLDRQIARIQKRERIADRNALAGLNGIQARKRRVRQIFAGSLKAANGLA